MSDLNELLIKSGSRSLLHRTHSEHNEYKVSDAAAAAQHKRELHNTWSIIAIVASAIDYYSVTEPATV